MSRAQERKRVGFDVATALPTAPGVAQLPPAVERDIDFLRAAKGRREPALAAAERSSLVTSERASRRVQLVYSREYILAKPGEVMNRLRALEDRISSLEGKIDQLLARRRR